jgi:hypothetical protein
MLECNHASITKDKSGTVVGTPVYLPASCRHVAVIVDSEGAGAGSFQLQAAGTAEQPGTWANVGTAVAAVPGGSANGQFVGSYLALRLSGAGVVAGCTARIVATT